MTDNAAGPRRPTPRRISHEDLALAVAKASERVALKYRDRSLLRCAHIWIRVLDTGRANCSAIADGIVRAGGGVSPA